MDRITFFDLLGIDFEIGSSSLDPSAVDRAAALWPDDIVSQTPGFNVADDSKSIVLFLQGTFGSRTVEFTNVRPGVDGSVQIGAGQGQLTLAADVHINPDAGTLPFNPFYFRQLPDIGITPFKTKPEAPAHCYFAKDSRGWELIVEALPAIITLKAGMIEPSDPTVASEGDAGEYNEDELDNLVTVRRRDPDGTQFYTSIRIHIRPGGDVILEPNIPLNQDKCRFLGLPVNALYDLLVIPAPQNREYYEWARNDLSGFISAAPVSGAIGFRSVDFDFSKPPFSDLQKHLKDGAVHPDHIELVCEDIVFPLSFLGVPIPSHGTLGFRRRIVDRSNLENAFSLKDSPVVIQLYPRTSTSGDDTTDPTKKPGSTLSLSIDQMLLQSGEPPVIEFQAALIWQSGTGTTVGGSVGITDDWTLQLGIVLGDQSPAKFTVVDNTVSIHAAKFGIGFGRLRRGVDEDQCWQILADISIQGKPTSLGTIFKLRSLTGKPLSLILRDIGYSFGHISIEGLSFPEGVQLIVCQVFRLIIEEMGWVEEPSGTPYFSFSGGFGVGFGSGDAIQPSGAPTYGAPEDANANRKKNADGFAIEVRRLRFNTRDDSPEPFFKVDGISLFLKYGNVLIAGFGFVSDTESDGWKIREMGFGVQIQLDVLATTWMLAAQFFKGHREQISDPSVAFDYFLAGLTVGYLPAGSVGFYAVRVLLANNMTPATDPSSPDGHGMLLYNWHKDHDTAIDMPRDRNLGDWKAEDNSLACGIGFGFSFNGGGKVMHINFFLLLSQSEEERGLLAVGELFLLKNPKPIAFVAAEVNLDTGKFGILIGLNLKLSDFVGEKTQVPDWIKNLVTISGNIYFGNQPWTIAIGQLADPRTWPAVQVKFHKHVLVNVDIDFVLAVCFQWVDGGPKGFGVVFSLTAGATWGIGQVNFFGSIGFIIGNWKTGSDATGAEVWIQLGFKVYLFFVLHIGADVTARLTYLGKHPWYTTLSLTLRIDTPWWMPDVSFSYDKTWNESLPYDVDLLTRPLSSASALGTGPAKEIPLLVPPLSDGNADPDQLYSFNAFIGVSGTPLGDVHLRTDIPIVSIDSTVAINFTNPVSNDMGVAPETFGQAGDAGVQEVQDLTVRYGLKSIAVRRSPRFGAGAGTWTDLVAPTDTALDLSGGSVHLAPALAFRWDADSRSDGSLSPRRLLLNSTTPYTFTTGGGINDEEAMRNDAGFPCCDTGDTIKRYFPRPHVLSFQDATAGTRLPSRQQFSGQGTWWQWNAVPLPLATLGISATTNTAVVAMLHPAGPGLLGSADLADPAVQASCSLSWNGAAATAFFEGYAGLKLIARQQAVLTAPGSVTLRLTAPQATPMSRLLLRVDGTAGLPAYSLQVERIDYVSASENALYQGRVFRCGSISATGGKLAFLPNYDYEITVTTEAKVSAKSQGERSSNLSEVVYFRTKGLPGLNAVTNTGDEIESYIESLYPPAQAALLYRAEPVALAFTEGMSSILPVDRVNAPTDPPEKTQAMELALNIDRVGSPSGLARLTVPSGDWIDAHRTMPPPRSFPRAIVVGTDVRAGVRRAPSFDPLSMRFQAVQSASPICDVDPLRSSQVLLHEPVGDDNQAGPWEPSTTFRATVRQKNGPYTQRTSFDILDSGAFVSQADGAVVPAGAWTVNTAGALVAPAAGPGRQYASLGELTWNHLQIRSRFDPHGVPAGIAVGVAGQSPVPQAILATVEPDGGAVSLVLRARDGSGETELGRTPVAVGGQVTLTVYAFDDAVRAQVGDAIVEAQRGAIREGRVALVASGPAEFFTVSVDGLDLYRFDFHTSQYQSFIDHINSWDGRLIEMAEGAAGATSAPLAGLLAADSALVAGAMKRDADPQGRQALFTKWMSALGLLLRQRPEGLCISGWTGATGTQALLIESPEPISFTRDVSVSMVQHVPQPPWHPIGPPELQAALMHLHFAGNVVTVPIPFAIFLPGGSDRSHHTEHLRHHDVRDLQRASQDFTDSSAHRNLARDRHAGKRGPEGT